MVKKYLETHMEELLKEKLELENKKTDLNNRLKELERFIELLEEKNDSSFEAFTPREVNPKNKEKIRELQAEKKALQKETEEVKAKKKENETAIEELTAMLHYLKKEEIIQKDIVENVSREKTEQLKAVTEQLEAFSQKMNHSLQFIEIDQTRSKLELRRLIPQLQNIIEEMQSSLSEKMEASEQGYIDVPSKNNNIKIEFMQESDIEEFYQAFLAQGWDKPRSLFETYYEEQKNGKRKVYVARYEEYAVGYATLLEQDTEGPFANAGIPVVYDFNVLQKYQHQGIGNTILDVIEEDVRKTSDRICLGVGLYTSYGTAQRMYVKRGYIPDGSGVWYQNHLLEPYADCKNDDDLVLYLSKELR